MSNDLDEFFDALDFERAWEDNEAFAWEAQRTWINWWHGPVIGRPTRVYVERAGPQMRAHP